jgi:hypothetical protein
LESIHGNRFQDDAARADLYNMTGSSYVVYRGVTRFSICFRDALVWFCQSLLGTRDAGESCRHVFLAFGHAILPGIVFLN